jgi:hypothetical protein
MKTGSFLMFAIGLCMHTAVFAQSNHTSAPSWVSDKGWWVVESNIHTPKQHIVYFYNNDGILVYKEKVEGLRLNPARRTIKMGLKQVLETSVLAWEKQHQPKENESLIVTQLGKKQD